jgi:orotidine-5'-phosphate decarboxylase
MNTTDPKTKVRETLSSQTLAPKNTDPKIIVALDYPDAEPALQLVNQLTPDLCRLKVGKELFTAAGPQLIESVQQKGFEVFLDLKFHDIPNTVAKACEAAAKLGVWMVNVHALGGQKMMQAAREALDKFEQRPRLIAVTILTSMDQQDIAQVGLNGAPGDNVLSLARLAKDSGLDGVVCSPKEVAQLRQEIAGDFLLVTPGVRPQGASQDDQKRTMTPKQALQSGASYLVIGRPITQADNPLQALKVICTEIM